MKPIGLLTIGLLAVFVAILAVAVVGQAADSLRGPSAAELAADYARAEQIAREAELAAQWAPVRAALANLLLIAAGVGAVAYAGALAFFHVERVRSERRPDARGLLPVAAADQHTARAALAGFHAARLEEARRPLVPQSLHYAPHYSHRQDAAALLPAAEAPQIAAPVPTFAALLEAGRVGQGNPLLLGHDTATGAAVEGSWLDLYSCAVGGLSGSGKSWTAAFLAAQAALYGSRIVLLDPHADNAESLAQRLAPMRARFVCDVAVSPREMLGTVRLATEELERRRRGGRGEPWVFIADEFSALQRGELAEPLADLVEALGQEGRKLGLYAMVCGQVWTATRAGGTELRDSLASAYIHRLRPAQARYLSGLTAADLPGDLLELPAGSAYLLNTAGDLRRVTIPHMAAGDVARVAALLDGEGAASAAEAAARSRPLGFVAARPRPGDGPDSGPGRATASGRGETALSAEDAQILAKFADGATVHDLAATLAGTANPGDRKYKAARERVEALLRRLAARSRAV